MNARPRFQVVRDRSSVHGNACVVMDDERVMSPSEVEQALNFYARAAERDYEALEKAYRLLIEVAQGHVDEGQPRAWQTVEVHPETWAEIQISAAQFARGAVGGGRGVSNRLRCAECGKMLECWSCGSWPGEDHVTTRHLDELKAENERLRQQIAEVKTQATIVFCENCGGSWVDDGFNGGCACHKVQHLKDEVERLRAFVKECANDGCGHGPTGHTCLDMRQPTDDACWCCNARRLLREEDDE